MTSTKTRTLIINADDYGMNAATVDGIIEAVAAGMVTSTTVMATGEGFDYGMARRASLGDISIGVHLDATSGRPLSGVREIPTLVDAATGKFLDHRTPGVTENVNPEELRLDFRAQIERVIGAGVKPSHFDNHHNWIYFRPELFRVVAELAAEYGVQVRFPFAGLTQERMSVFAGLTGKSEEQVRMAARLGQQYLDELGVAYPDRFWIEFTSIHRSKDYFAKLITELPEGLSEICVHPGNGTERQVSELAILKEVGAGSSFELAGDVELVSFEALRGRIG